MTDAITLRRFDLDSVFVSPHGDRFAVVSERGDLTCDCNIATVSFYSSKSVRRLLLARANGSVVHAEPLVQFERRTRPGNSSTVYPLVYPVWLSNNEFAFSGSDRHGWLQAFSYELERHRLRKLTSLPKLASMVRVFKDGLIISTFKETKRRDYPYPATVLNPKTLVPDYVEATSLMHRRGGAVTQIIRGGEADVSMTPIFSPDRRWALWPVQVRNPPETWVGYSKVPRVAPVLRLMLLDVARGQLTPLINAPDGDFATGPVASIGTSLWGKDSRHVIIFNSALPLTDTDPERRSNGYVISVDVVTKRWTVLEKMRESRPGVDRVATEIGWLDASKVVILHRLGEAPDFSTIYELKASGWAAQSSAKDVTIKRKWYQDDRQPAPSGLSFKIIGDANTPEELSVSDGKSSVSLMSAFPKRSGVDLLQETKFKWTAPTARTEEAGLILPVGRPRKLPLVIQLGAYRPATFEPSRSMHLYAGQMLANRGFAVLNINGKAETGADVENYIDKIRSAVSELNNQGIIDINRVGLIGFSRQGFVVRQFLTDSTAFTPAAAIIDDSFHGTYRSYLENALDFRSEWEKLFGGPFWQNKRSWLEKESSFNAEKIKTPILFTIHRESNLDAAREDFGMLSLTGRPFTYLLFSNGYHELVRPMQRFVSYRATLDWMSFWLQSIESSNSEFSRDWPQIRRTWQRQQAWDASHLTELAAKQLPKRTH